MSNSIIYYKNFDVKNLEISKPIRQSNGKYTSSITYNGNKCSIQSPEIHLDNENLSFSMVNKGIFFTILEDINNKVVDTLYQKSADFFGGRKFSEERIVNSLNKTIEVEDTGRVVFKNISFSKNMNVYDRFKTKISLPSEPFQGSCIICIDHLEFSGKNIIIRSIVKSVRVLSFLKKKNKSCMFDEPIDNLEQTEDFFE